MRSEPEIRGRLEELRVQCEVWTEYLQVNVRLKNWHGVEDAASDLRDFEAEMKALVYALGQPSVIRMESHNG